MKKLLVLILISLFAFSFTSCKTESTSSPESSYVPLSPMTPIEIPERVVESSENSMKPEEIEEINEEDLEENTERVSLNTEKILKDGTYMAEAGDFDRQTGWKDKVTITIKDGKIATVEWDGEHRDGGTDKKARSKDGNYGMVEEGGAKLDWHVQAERMEKELLETQDINEITVKNSGATDEVSGVSINVSDFKSLAKKALEKAES